MVSPSQLRQWFDYEPETGILKRIVKVGRNCSLGPVGYLDSYGYPRIKLSGRSVRVHRIVWAWMTGKWSEIDIDHINTVKSDNRWVNLREATRSENSANRGMPKNNTSGQKGVCYKRKRDSYQAQIRVGGRLLFLGYFKKADDAASHIKTRQTGTSANMQG